MPFRCESRVAESCAPGPRDVSLWVACRVVCISCDQVACDWVRSSKAKWEKWVLPEIPTDPHYYDAAGRTFVVCPEGFYCPPKATKAQSCLAGHYCPQR